AAIVDEISGVTRDRHYGKCEWNGRDFTVIDTGGYVKGSDDIFEAEIRKQVEIAVEEASMLIFVVDVTTGVTDLDKTVANLLRRTKKKIFLVANKVDNGERETWSAEFYSLGLGDLYNISAVNGSGTGDLLDDVVKALPDDENILPDLLPKLAIVGRPNVGKSSLLNALVGEDRNIVTNIAGTTRDVLREHIHIDGLPLHIIDTAGLRETGDIVEKEGIRRAYHEINQADGLLLVYDLSTELSTNSEKLSPVLMEDNQSVDNSASYPQHMQELSTGFNPLAMAKQFFDPLPLPNKLCFVANKCDLVAQEPHISVIEGYPHITLSARQGLGLEQLRNYLKALVGYQDAEHSPFIARRRHLDALRRTEDALQQAHEQLHGLALGELMAEDLRAAQQALGEITGAFTADDLLGKIFSSFCIGK
ncbi:MAG: hypothetical protein RJA86_1125, partial [Pseudomonadota bacterium]